MRAESTSGLHIGAIQRSFDGVRRGVTSDIHGLDAPFTMRFSTESPALGETLGESGTADAFLIAILPAAMQLGLDVTCATPISRQLMDQLPTVMSIFSAWYDDFRPIEVRAPTIASVRGTTPGVASFFSGGVDSFFSALDRHPDITHLVAVHGFDVPVQNSELWNVIRPRLDVAAAALDRPLVVIETNLREWTDRVVSWPLHEFGAALAAVATLLAPVVTRVIIPASETYRHLEPCGSHPLLDPLWSTEAVDIEHHGAAFTRNQKLARIAESEVAMHHLRVCWENPNNLFNCGRCEKCVRTMLGLTVAGAMDRCRTFPHPLTPELVRATRIPFDLVLFHAEANLAAIRQTCHRELGDALESVIARYRAARLARELRALPSHAWRYLLRDLLHVSSS